MLLSRLLLLLLLLFLLLLLLLLLLHSTAIIIHVEMMLANRCISIYTATATTSSGSFATSFMVNCVLVVLETSNLADIAIPRS